MWDEYFTKDTAPEWWNKMPVLFFFISSLKFQFVSICFLICIIYLSSYILLQEKELLELLELILYIFLYPSCLPYNFAVPSYGGWAKLPCPLTCSLAMWLTLANGLSKCHEQKLMKCLHDGACILSYSLPQPWTCGCWGLLEECRGLLVD